MFIILSVFAIIGKYMENEKRLLFFICFCFRVLCVVWPYVAAMAAYRPYTGPYRARQYKYIPCKKSPENGLILGVLKNR